MILHALWADFEKKIIPTDAAEWQRQEMRRANAAQGLRNRRRQRALA